MNRTTVRVFCIASFIAGFGWLVAIDWRIAICVLMTHWANNARIDLDDKETKWQD